MFLVAKVEVPRSRIRTFLCLVLLSNLYNNTVFWKLRHVGVHLLCYPLIQVSLYQKRVPQKSLKMSEKAHEMNSRVSKIFIVVVLGKLIIFEVNSKRRRLEC